MTPQSADSVVTPASTADELRAAPACVWSVVQVAACWGVRVNTVRKLIAMGELRCLRVGDLIKIRSADLADFHDRHAQ